MKFTGIISRSKSRHNKNGIPLKDLEMLSSQTRPPLPNNIEITMKLRILIISLLILTQSTVSYAFKIGNFESGMSYEQSAEIISSSSDKQILESKLGDNVIHCFYLYNNRKYILSLHYTNKSKKLFMASLRDNKTKDTLVLDSKFLNLRSYLDSIYGIPETKKLEVARYDRGKEEKDFLDHYFYNTETDKIQLTYSSKIQSITVHFNDKKYSRINRKESPPIPHFKTMEEAQEYFKKQAQERNKGK